MTYEELKKEIDKRASEKLALFNRRIIPTGERICGVSNAEMRKLARELAKNETAETLMSYPIGEIYEVDFVRALAICRMSRPIGERLAMLFEVSSSFDNWAIVDVSAAELKMKKGDSEAVSEYAIRLMGLDGSKEPFRVRLGVTLAMQLYLDGAETAEVERAVLGVICDENYYVDMALGWYYSLKIIKDFDAGSALLDGSGASVNVYNKAIQKSIDSKRLTAEEKDVLRKKRKKGKKVSY